MDNHLRREEIGLGSSVRYDIHTISWEGAVDCFKDASEDYMVELLEKYLDPTNFRPMIFM